MSVYVGMYLLPEGPVLCAGLVHLLGPLDHHVLRSNVGLDLSVDVLEGGEGDGLPSGLQAGHTVVVLHYSAVPVQTMVGAVLCVCVCAVCMRVEREKN